MEVAKDRDEVNVNMTAWKEEELWKGGSRHTGLSTSKMNGLRTLTLCLLFYITLQGCRGEDFYSFTVKDHEGSDFALEKYRGKVTLVVNVASQCGYTDSTYRALKKLHDILSYGDFFSVLAFPCNQFGDQEPFDMPEIIEFVTKEYKVEFPIFNKISVVGEHADPAFKFLIETSSVVPDWNFYKYLVDETGQVIGAWGTRTLVEDIFDDIQAAVKKVKAKQARSAGGKQKVDKKESETPKDEL